MPGDLPHETHRSPQGPSYQLSLTIESKPTLSWSYSGVRIYSASPFGSRSEHRQSVVRLLTSVPHPVPTAKIDT
jgi:hypothetical protein